MADRTAIVDPVILAIITRGVPTTGPTGMAVRDPVTVGQGQTAPTTTVTTATADRDRAEGDKWQTLSAIKSSGY
jgi:hypothetical protein